MMIMTTATELRRAIEQDNRKVQRLGVDAELRDLVSEFTRQLLAKGDDDLSAHYGPCDPADWCKPAWTLAVR